MIEGISAVTLGTHELPRAVRFYRALGLLRRLMGVNDFTWIGSGSPASSK